MNPRSLRITIAHNTQYSQKGRVAAKLSNSYALRQPDCHIEDAITIDQQSLCTVPEIALLLNDKPSARGISFAGSVPAQKGNRLSSLRIRPRLPLIWLELKSTFNVISCLWNPE